MGWFSRSDRDFFLATVVPESGPRQARQSLT